MNHEHDHEWRHGRYSWQCWSFWWLVTGVMRKLIVFNLPLINCVDSLVPLYLSLLYLMFRFNLYDIIIMNTIRNFYFFYIFSVVLMILFLCVVCCVFAGHHGLVTRGPLEGWTGARLEHGK